MVTIHPTAIVDPAAQLGENVEVGAFTTIKADVQIGDNTWIGNGAVLDDGTRIGAGCKIGHYSILGNPPQDLKYKNEKTYLEIGDNTIIREFCTLNRGTDYHYKTAIGSNCFIMTYVHVAHDCLIGDNVILANAVNLAGHVEVHDFVTIGGMTPVHQFVKIGKYAFVGGGLRVNKDVPPYIRAMGEPIRYGGTNFIGLERKGFSRESIREIKKAYDIIYRSDLTVKEALVKIEETLPPTDEIKTIVDFVRKSERGLIRGGGN
ncbi:MAG: acyl-ACP--UDP-N-acetylglucosamine O-acyltransferase [Calditrichia bacterium]